MSTAPPQPPQSGAQETDPALAAGRTPTSAVPVGDLIDLPSGRELDEIGAAKLQASRPVRTVVVAGPVMCGKTTLLTSLYELFQWGKVSDYSFAGSDTLPAFERRCYHSRTASERAVPDTERTPYGQVRYLHLRIARGSLSEGLMDFLFTDVSGESFERARDSIEECQHLDFLRQADHFLLLLDSEKLITKERRWQVAHDSMTLLRSCLDSGMLDGRCLVNVLFTKYDYFRAAEDEEHADFLGKLIIEFQTEFGKRVGRLSFSKVAARPTQADDLGFGHGIPELLKDWATVSPRERAMSILPDETMGARESELFTARHFKSVKESQ
jgi:hypothetical protein